MSTLLLRLSMFALMFVISANFYANIVIYVSFTYEKSLDIIPNYLKFYISSIVGGCNLALLRTSCREQTKGEGSQEGGARAEAAGEY